MLSGRVDFHGSLSPGSVKLTIPDEDELENPEWKFQEMKRLIESPDETEYREIFLHVGYDEDPGWNACLLPRPAAFYDPKLVAEARKTTKYYREQGYCPLHRHPTFVRFIEVVTSIYTSVLQTFIENVDLEAARSRIKSKHSSDFKIKYGHKHWANPENQSLQEEYQWHELLRSFVSLLHRPVDRIAWMADESEEENGTERTSSYYTECKGIPPSRCLLYRILTHLKAAD